MRLNKIQSQTEGRVQINEYVSRDVILKIMSKCDFLINLENIGNIQTPSKLIDYFISGRPILSIPSNNFKSEIIIDFINGNYSNKFKVDNIEDYNISNVSKKFINLISNES